jgi:hypothetical protein
VRLPRGLRSIRTRLTVWYTGLLLVILLLIGTLSYQVLAWSLYQDVDASLVAVAQVIRDTEHARGGGGAAEAALRELLGPDFVDKFFQLRDPEGRLGEGSASLRNRGLPLSSLARTNAARGQPTFETLILPGGDGRARLLTLPVFRDGRPAGLVQVGISLARAEGALRRYLRVLLAVVPVGLGLAAVGGALIARAALAPVNAMARTARRITAEGLSQRISAGGAGDELTFSRRRSTGCSRGWRRPSTRCGASPPTPPTSSAPRSPPSRAGSRSPSAPRAHRRSTGGSSRRAWGR